MSCSQKRTNEIAIKHGSTGIVQLKKDELSSMAKRIMSLVTLPVLTVFYAFLKKDSEASYNLARTQQDAGETPDDILFEHMSDSNVNKWVENGGMITPAWRKRMLSNPMTAMTVAFDIDGHASDDVEEALCSLARQYKHNNFILSAYYSEFRTPKAKQELMKTDEGAYYVASIDGPSDETRKIANASPSLAIQYALHVDKEITEDAILAVEKHPELLTNFDKHLDQIKLLSESNRERIRTAAFSKPGMVHWWKSKIDNDQPNTDTRNRIIEIGDLHDIVVYAKNVDKEPHRSTWDAIKKNAMARRQYVRSFTPYIITLYKDELGIDDFQMQALINESESSLI